MKHKYRSSKSFETLRKKAEKILETQSYKLPEVEAQDLMRLLHEVEVQQVELEIQNEELYRANKELENSRNQFADLYQSAPVAIISLNEKGTIEQVNDAAAHLFTGFKNFYVGTAFSSLITPEDQGVYFSYLKEFVSNRTSASCELRLLAEEGRSVHVQLTARVGQQGAESKLQWHLAMVDITESKQAEEELRATKLQAETDKRHLEAILQALPVGVTVTDAQGGVLLSNDMDEKIWGPRPVTRDVDDYLQYKAWWPDSGKPVEPHEWASAQAVLKAEFVLGQVMEIQRFDGERGYILNSAVPIRDDDGRVIGSVVAIQEITELRRAQKVLHDREELLKISLAEKEVLLKEIHHRVKNNMQVVSSLVALQADESEDAATREIFREIAQRVRSMAMVHEKLYQSADLARIDFADYVQSLLNYLWNAHGTSASGIRLELDLQPVSLPVNAAIPCGLILNELIANALKHAFRGRENGKVTVALHDGEKGRVRLCVSDNGSGLPAGFEWRKANSLGLRLVQMLARQLSAAVDVSGEKGTRFTIKFQGADL